MPYLYIYAIKIHETFRICECRYLFYQRNIVTSRQRRQTDIHNGHQAKKKHFKCDLCAKQVL